MLNLKNTLDGYLKNVEVIGNTVQDANNLADIRSVGDKVEGQELYKIPVLSCGKNLFDGKLSIGSLNANGSFNASVADRIVTDFIFVGNIKTLTISNIDTSIGRICVYDKNKNFMHQISASSSIIIGDDVHYIRFHMMDTTNVNMELQIEEGTVATPYEPYKENKLEILSPVQLEKVGGVADRIICKDGIWGVEKNIETYKLDQGHNVYNYILNNLWLQTSNTTAFYTYYFRDNADVKILNKNGSAMCDILPYSYQNINQTDSPAVYSGSQYVAFRIPTSELKTPDIFGVRDWMDEKQPTIKYIRETPQFIPLPHNQQVKLRTFAGQTNIAFLTEIAGQVKAQVPKSLGAVVNTHTEQIEILHNALKSVLAGDMYSLATILYPEDFEQNDNTEQDIMTIPE